MTASGCIGKLSNHNRFFLKPKTEKDHKKVLEHKINTKYIDKIMTGDEEPTSRATEIELEHEAVEAAGTNPPGYDVKVAGDNGLPDVHHLLQENRFLAGV